MSDIDLMPFGKYKGKMMQDVPVTYFHYLWCNGMKQDKASPVHQYIKDNLSAFEQENDDLIWT